MNTIQNYGSNESNATSKESEAPAPLVINLRFGPGEDLATLCFCLSEQKTQMHEDAAISLALGDIESYFATLDEIDFLETQFLQIVFQLNRQAEAYNEYHSPRLKSTSEENEYLKNRIAEMAKKIKR